MFRQALTRLFNPAQTKALHEIYEQARHHLKQNDLYTSQALFKKVLKSDPNCIGARRNLIKIDIKLEEQGLKQPPPGL